MPKKRFSAEQIVTLLSQIEVAMGHGKSTQIACVLKPVPSAAANSR